jgi:hypothetical protein
MTLPHRFPLAAGRVVLSSSGNPLHHNKCPRAFRTRGHLPHSRKGGSGSDNRYGCRQQLHEEVLLWSAFPPKGHTSHSPQEVTVLARWSYVILGSGHVSVCGPELGAVFGEHHQVAVVAQN